MLASDGTDMEETTAALATVAREAVQAPAAYLTEAFRNGPVDGEYSSSDVKTVADREAEARVRAVIDDAYPDHVFHGEESGRIGDSEYEWVVDPLDGTNNFASGYPAFATAVAVLYRGEAVVAAIYEPLTKTLYLAERGGGATVNGEPLQSQSSVSLANGTVSLVVGLEAMRDAELSATADALRTAVSDECKRVVLTWAPCVDWGLVARGSIEGLVAFHPDRYEHHAGRLLAAESGVAAHDAVAESGIYVAAPDSATTETLKSCVESVTE